MRVVLALAGAALLFGSVAALASQPRQTAPIIIAESAPPASTKPRPPITFDKQSEKVVDDWVRCTLAASAQLYSPNASATEIAMAALGTCRDYEKRYIADLERRNFSRIGSVIAGMRERLTERIVTEVLKARASKGGAPSMPAPKSGTEEL